MSHKDAATAPDQRFSLPISTTSSYFRILIVLKTHITTARLQLRPLELAEAPLLQTYLLNNRAHLAAWEPARDQDFFSLEHCQKRLVACSEQMARGQALYLAVFLRETGEIIGSCNFSNIVRGVFQACHLGYSIAASEQGKNYMFEAVQAGISHIFKEHKLRRIMANYLPENQRSAALLKRLGFVQEGYARVYLKINGVWRDHILSSLVNPDDQQPV